MDSICLVYDHLVRTFLLIYLFSDMMLLKRSYVMRELSVIEVNEVSGGISWQSGSNAIFGLALVGLTVGTGGVGLFGMAIWASLEYANPS